MFKIKLVAYLGNDQEKLYEVLQVFRGSATRYSTTTLPLIKRGEGKYNRQIGRTPHLIVIIVSNP